MPQVDLESLVCGVGGAGAGDRKVSCETVITGGSGDASPPRMPPPPDLDFPPESITIPIGDEVALSELNPIYERDDSTKGSTNPKFAAAAGAANPIAAKTRSNSTRVAGAPAAAGTTFFGLPAKIRPHFSRRQPSQGRILPDKRGAGGRGEGEAEPRSPKVSCIGKVLSDRERHGRPRRRGRGWWHGVVAMFRCDGCCRADGGSAAKKTADDEDGLGQQQHPGIAGMRGFKSGRRAASWGDEALAAAVAAAVEDEAAKVDQQQHDSHYTELWARRQVD